MDAHPQETTEELQAKLLANLDDEVADAVAAHEEENEEEGKSVGVNLPGGSIRFYYKDKRFEATCMNDAHKTRDGTRCRLTRVGCINPDMSSENGRPIGTLAAWLQEGGTDGLPLLVAAKERKRRSGSTAGVGG